MKNNLSRWSEQQKKIKLLCSKNFKYSGLTDNSSDSRVCESDWEMWGMLTEMVF